MNVEATKSSTFFMTQIQAINARLRKTLQPAIIFQRRREEKILPSFWKG